MKHLYKSLPLQDSKETSEEKVERKSDVESVMAVSTYELTVTVVPKQDKYKIKHVKTSITRWYRVLNVSALQEPMVMNSY